jgi:glycosyltransferase involved in cell wall biosynthesis
VKEEDKIDISIVVPVCNEEENLPILIPRLVEVLEPLGKTYEMIFVDDGSKDKSREVLREMSSRHLQIRLLGFKYNCGGTAALDAGLREARGKIVVTLDADLQNDPRDIPKMLDYLKEYDMVSGWQADPWVKRITSRLQAASDKSRRIDSG